KMVWATSLMQRSVPSHPWKRYCTSYMPCRGSRPLAIAASMRGRSSLCTRRCHDSKSIGASGGRPRLCHTDGVSDVRIGVGPPSVESHVGIDHKKTWAMPCWVAMLGGLWIALVALEQR